MIFVPDRCDLLAQYKDVWKLFSSKYEVLCGVNRHIESFILALDRDAKAQVTFSFSIFILHLLKTNIYICREYNAFGYLLVFATYVFCHLVVS